MNTLKTYTAGSDAGVIYLVENCLGVKCAEQRSVNDADLVIFPGGFDVSPGLYGERQLSTTSCDPLRDSRDIYTWELARKHGKKIIGICRGSQFISVMLGGKLWQHVENHQGPHAVVGADFDINSYHHQGVVEHGGIKVIHKCDPELYWHSDKDECWGRNVEAYTAEKVFAVQWHPEYIYWSQKHPQCLDWYANALNMFMNGGEVK